MTYVARRVAYLVPTWLGITLMAFVMAQFAPGDPAAGVFAREHGRQASRVELERTRHELGLDDPAPQRYLRSVADAVQGDLGTSYTSGRPVMRELLERFPATLELASAGTLLAVGVHAMKNALPPVVTQVGLVFGYMLAYSAIVEVVFIWPGISRLAVESISQRDYPVIQGFVIFAGTGFILVNLLVDLIYQRLDPRISLSSLRQPAAI